MAQEIKFTDEEVKQVSELRDASSNKVVEFGQLKIEVFLTKQRLEELYRAEAQLEEDFESQTKGLLEIQQRNNAIEGEMNRYLDIFKRHDLTKSAAAKPDQLEIRVNNGTKKVFDSIEEDSRNIDDRLQLQPATN